MDSWCLRAPNIRTGRFSGSTTLALALSSPLIRSPPSCRMARSAALRVACLRAPVNVQWRCRDGAICCWVHVLRAVPDRQAAVAGVRGAGGGGAGDIKQLSVVPAG